MDTYDSHIRFHEEKCRWDVRTLGNCRNVKKVNTPCLSGSTGDSVCIGRFCGQCKHTKNYINEAYHYISQLVRRRIPQCRIWQWLLQALLACTSGILPRSPSFSLTAGGSVFKEGNKSGDAFL